MVTLGESATVRVTERALKDGQSKGKRGSEAKFPELEDGFPGLNNSNPLPTRARARFANRPSDPL
jgi:hypothetical protein